MELLSALFGGRYGLLRALGELVVVCNMTAGTITSKELPPEEVAALNRRKRETMKAFRSAGRTREPMQRLASISLDEAAIHAERYRLRARDIENDALLARQAAERWDDPLVAVSLVEHAVCEEGVFLGAPTDPDAYLRAADGDAAALVDAFAHLQLFAYVDDPTSAESALALKRALAVLIERGQRVAQEPKHYFDLGILERQDRFPDLDSERVLFPRNNGMVLFHKLKAVRVLGAGTYGVAVAAVPRPGFGSPYGPVAVKVQSLAKPLEDDVTARLEVRVQAELTKFFFPLRFSSEGRLACAVKLLDFEAGVADDLTGWAFGAGRFDTFEDDIKKVQEDSVRERSMVSVSELCLGSLDVSGHYTTGPHAQTLSVIAQVAATLVLLQRELRFVHNDMAPRNILTVVPDGSPEFFSFQLGDRYVNVPAAWSEGALVKLNDFGFAHLEVRDLHVFNPEAPGFNPYRDLHQLACEIIADMANWCKHLDTPWTAVDRDLKRLLALMLSTNAFAAEDDNYQAACLSSILLGSAQQLADNGFCDPATKKFDEDFYDTVREAAKELWLAPYDKERVPDPELNKSGGYPNLILPQELFEHPASQLSVLLEKQPRGVEVNVRNPRYDSMANVKARAPIR